MPGVIAAVHFVFGVLLTSYTESWDRGSELRSHPFVVALLIVLQIALFAAAVKRASK